jgi:hypothetical protein
MPNQIDPDRRRAVFIIDKEDFSTLEKFAEKTGYTTSVLLREATFRLAEQIRNNKKITLELKPKESEGRRH